MRTILRISGAHYQALQAHLIPTDGKEAVAVMLCGRRAGEELHVLCAHQLVLIPHDACTERTPLRVSWPTSILLPHLETAIRRGLAVVKIHSHRGDYRFFSETDDASDRDLFASVYGWFDGDLPHASSVMLPSGEIFGRVVTEQGGFDPLGSVAVAGDDYLFWPAFAESSPLPAFTQRHAQVFGQGTTGRLRQLSAAVIGCSGTGSPLIEQLVRLGIGKLLLVDPDVVEERNLNRILHASLADAEAKRPKVEVMQRAIGQIGLGCEVVALQRNLVDPEVVKQVAGCDVLFGCMDGAEGRNLLNRLATFYCQAYFDVGVRLEADGQGGVSQVCGGAHYLQPGGSSLLSRGVITAEDIEAEALRRTDPAEYERRFKVGYIRGIREDRPAVISVNMHFASMAINEFLARLHPFRDDANADFAWVSSSLTQMHIYTKPDGAACAPGEACGSRGRESTARHADYVSVRCRLMVFFRTLWRRIRNWWVSVWDRPYRSVMVEELPDHLAKKTSYIADEGPHLWYVAMICPCGCGETLQMSLLSDARPRWTVSVDSNGLPSLSPSVWRQVGCGSHFFLVCGRVRWCP
jgi:hypothetical protein